VAKWDGGIYVTVTWTEPENNCGAEVTRYVIKYHGHSWPTFRHPVIVTDSDKLSVEGNRTNFQFTNQLNDWRSYQFAVAAVNAFGRGKFSEFTDNVDTQGGKYCCKSHVKYCKLM